MAILSSGYNGTVDEVQAAKRDEFHGVPYAVAGSGDWKVTAVAGVDRTVSVAAGTGFGRHVRDVSDAAATVQLPTLASGIRWDLIVARRDWATNTTSFTYVTGTSNPAAAIAGRNANPGVLDDQPVALVQITAGQQVPTQVVDVRVTASKAINADTTHALLYHLDRIGTHVWVGDVLYRRVLDGSGNPSWATSDFGDTGWVSVAVSQYSGSVKHRRKNGHVTVEIELDSVAAARSTSANVAFAVLPSASRPSSTAHGFVVVAGSRWYRARVLTNGTVEVVGMTLSVGESLTGAISFPV